jgi:hypothetical protein
MVELRSIIDRNSTIASALARRSAHRVAGAPSNGGL